MAADSAQLQIGGKRASCGSDDTDARQKRRKVLFNDDDSADNDSVSSRLEDATVKQNADLQVISGLQINEEYARRFEHNKKREELRRLQDKYGILPDSSHNQEQARMIERPQDDISDSSSDEDEDEDGILALGVLDEQVQSTLEAIRKKDPRVYDTSAKFYNDPDENYDDMAKTLIRQEKPLYLDDYHRNNLLNGFVTVDDDGQDEGRVLPNYQQQQDDLKISVVKEIHATIDDLVDEEGSDGSAKDDFLVKKVTSIQDQTSAENAEIKRIMLDVESADKDPETYLSNFMSAKGWVTQGDMKHQPFESDDEEEDRRAEAFEEAYNLRFEDPKSSNEKLSSHARDAAAKYSVRKEETNSRKRKRDIEFAHKDQAKQLRSEEKARLRKLKVAELQAKLEKIKDTAGLKREMLSEGDWSAFLNNHWDGDQWEQEMKKHFGDDYYDKYDVEDGDNDQDTTKRKIKKPRWKDDIDINDLVPDFEGDKDDQKPPFELTDAEAEAEGNNRKSKTSEKTTLKAEQVRRKELRVERRKIEQHVDEQLETDEVLATFGKKHSGFFRYRDTSPLSHGLTAHDILMAEDAQLNQFAGLKKLASFREPDRKRKDKKFLGKKQRLKQWRKETFGNENGPTMAFAEGLPAQNSTNVEQYPKRLEEEGDARKRAKKKRPKRLKEEKATA